MHSNGAHRIITVLVVLLLILQLTVASPFEVSISHQGCSDVSLHDCKLSFALSKSFDAQQTIQVLNAEWALGIKDLVHHSSHSHDRYCAFLPGRGLQLEFRSGETVVDCTILKSSNIFVIPTVASVVGTMGNNTLQSIHLPAIAYSNVGLHFVPSDEKCHNVLETNCTGILTLPNNMVKKFNIDTTSALSIKCPESITISNPYEVVKLADVEFKQSFTFEDDDNGKNNSITAMDGLNTFKVNRYAVSMTPNINDNNTNNVNNVVTCQIEVEKGQASPYFKVYIPYNEDSTTTNNNNGIAAVLNQLVYINYDIRYIDITLSIADNCNDHARPLCTVYFNNVPLQHTFSTKIDFFEQSYDVIPVIDPTYIPLGNERRYMQRFIKPLMMNSDTDKTIKKWSNVHFFGPLLQSYILQIEVQEFEYSEPLKLDYDLEVCQDPLTPICPVVVTSRYIGRPVTITLSRLPLSGVVERVTCDSGGLFIDMESPENVHFISPNATSWIRSSFSNPPLNLVDPLNGNENDTPFRCTVDMALPLDGQAWGNPLTSIVNFYIAQVTFFHPVKRIVALNIPLTELRRDEVRFNVLPFTMRPHDDCAAQQEPNCGYTFNISLHNTAVWGTDGWDKQLTQPEELQTILNKVYLRNFAVNVYNLRQPMTEYGETVASLMNVTVVNSAILLVDLHDVEWRSADLGYDIVHFKVHTHLDSLEFGGYFQKNKDTKLFEDILIHLTFWHSRPNEQQILDPTRHDRIYDLSLINYNGVPNGVENITPPLLYRSSPGELFYTPLFTFEVDEETCSNRHKAFCPLRCRVWVQLPYISGRTAYVMKDVVLHSMLVTLPASSVIDASLEYSTPGLNYFITSERIDPNTGKFADNIYINVTLPEYDTRNNDVLYYDFTLSLVKHLGTVNTLSRFQAWNHLFIRNVFIENENDEQNQVVIVDDVDADVGGNVDDNTTTNNNTPHVLDYQEWYSVSSPYFYALTYVQYVGSVVWVHDQNCQEKGSPICTAHIQIHTNNILPGTEIQRFDGSWVERVLYTTDTLYCEGWDGISAEDSTKYISFGVDTVTHEQYITLVNTEDELFSFTKPLHFDQSQRPYVQCHINGYKLYQPRALFTPLIFPGKFIGIDHRRDPRYSIYPISRLVPGLALNYPALRYSHFDMEGLDDCKTSYLNHLKCTLKFTSNASPQYPIDTIRLELPQDEARGHGLLSVTAMLGDVFYGSTFCGPNKKTTLKPSEYYAANPDEINPRTIELGLNITDDLVVRREYSMDTSPTAERFFGHQIDKTKPSFFGVYTYTYDLCDETTPIVIEIDLAPKYRTHYGVGHLLLYWGYEDYAEMGVDAPDMLQYGVQTHVLINMPRPLPSPTDVKYGLGEINIGTVAATPSRALIPPMVFGWLFTHEMSEARVTYAQNVTVTLTIYAQSVQTITIHSILGKFDTPDSYVTCDYPSYDNGLDENGELIITMRPLATLSTNAALGVSILNVNTTFLTEIRARTGQEATHSPIPCPLVIEVNAHYPSQYANVKHETQLGRLPEERFYSYRNYPMYSPSARIWDISESSLYNAAYYNKPTSNAVYIVISITMLFVVIMF